MAIPNKSPLKILEKMERGVSRDCPIFWVPLLSRERVKLRNSNLASTFTGPIRIKAHKNGEKGAWAYPGTAQMFWVPLISGTGKATDFKFCKNIHRSIGIKAHEKFWE